ncbi:L-lactate permease [Escherichia coli]
MALFMDYGQLRGLLSRRCSSIKSTVASGQFDIIRSSVISITDDQRLQVLLIGFSFGALLEGAAGFGAPVGDYRCAAGGPGLQTVLKTRRGCV